MILAQQQTTLLDGQSISGTDFVFSDWKAGRADYVTVQLGCSELAATELQYRIEGRFAGVDRAASLSICSITATNIDTAVTITDKYTQIRIGAKCNNDATPNVAYAYLLRTEIIK